MFLYISPDYCIRHTPMSRTFAVRTQESLLWSHPGDALTRGTELANSQVFEKRKKDTDWTHVHSS